MDMEIRKPQRNWKESVHSIIEMGKFLERMKSNFSRADLAKMARIDFNIDDSTISKVIKISNHPILSNPAYADKLPRGWGTLYELKFLPDEVLLKHLKAGGLEFINKYEIWALRGVKLTERKKRPVSQEGNGGRITVAGDRSLVQYVRDGMAELPDGADGQLIEDMAKKLKLGSQTFRMLRGMIILSERPELTQADKAMVNGLLEKVDRTRNVRTYFQQVKPLLDSIWGNARNKSFTDKSSQKRVDIFRNAIVILSDTCERVLEMSQPYMSTEDIDRSINDLTNARKNIGKLAENLRRSKND